MAHTPGPWGVATGGHHEYDASLPSAGPQWRVTYGLHTSQASGRHDAQANARLIAAAPDLLYACELAAAELTRHGWTGPEIRALRAAIAAAKGDAPR